MGQLFDEENCDECLASISVETHYCVPLEGFVQQLNLRQKYNLKYSKNNGCMNFSKMCGALLV